MPKEPLAVKHSIQLADMEQRLKRLEKILRGLLLKIPMNSLTNEEAKMIFEENKP